MFRKFNNRRQIRRLQGGFTLLEILIVMGIVGVLVAVIIPDFNRVIPEMKVDKAARKLATDLRMAQQKAIAEMALVRFRVEVGENRYYGMVRDRDDSSEFWLWQGYDDYVEDPLQGGAYLLVDFDDVTTFRGVDISSIDPNFAAGEFTGIYFSALGDLRYPAEYVTVTLSDPGTGYSRQVQVSYPLGKVVLLP